MKAKGEGPVTVFLAGDALVVRPWSHVSDPAFLRLVEEIRSADVSIVNLETVIHDFKGYAQHDSGGTYMASPPEIAAELKWAGFDMVAHANNHAFDYGSSAILETIEHAGKAGLILAGSGKDLQDARAPRYFDAGGARVGLVAMTTSFPRYGQASRSRSDMHGRPGVNPLTVSGYESAIVVPPGAAEKVRAVGRFFGRDPVKLDCGSFRVGLRFHVGKRFGIERQRRPDDIDRAANLATIETAAGNADFVVVSIHAHSKGPWLDAFARDAIAAGAGAVFIHGPHRPRGIAFHAGRPVFHSLGDFVYEIDFVARFPTEAYRRKGLGDDASPRDLIARSRANPRSVDNLRSSFEGLAAVLTLEGGKTVGMRLIPVDLQFDGPEERYGRPQWAAPEVGRRLIENVATASRRYGTDIRYDAKANCGVCEP